MALLEQLEKMDNLTPVEQEIVAYILEYKEQVVHLTISELAMVTYASNASIIRLCRKLGLAGYKEFKIELIKNIERRRKEKSDIDMSFPFRKKSSSHDILKSIAELSKEAIDSCYEHISEREMEQAANYLLQADTIYIYGYGDSLISAIGFANRLTKLNKHTKIASEYGELLTNTMNVKKSDAVLFVSYGGTLSRDERYIDILQESGCKKVMITSARDVKGFDLVLNIPDKEASGRKIATYYSQAVIQYTLNCLYAIMFSKKFNY